MTIRTFIGTDAYVLPGLWNEAFPHERVTREQWIAKVMLEPNFSPEGLFVAEENGKIIGFSNAVFRRIPMIAGADLEEACGWISAFALADPARMDDVGEALLNASESYLVAHGKTRISTGYYPIYFTQGFEKRFCPAYTALFERHGYIAAESSAITMKLDTYTEAPGIEEKRRRLIGEGYYIGALTDEYIASLLDINEPFNGASFATEFKLRFSDMDFTRVRIAAKDGHVVGACIFSDQFGEKEHFGPFAVNKELRGKGIGSVLLADCLNEMKRRGLPSVWMQWVGPQSVAMAMYKKLGFEEFKYYCAYTKFCEEASR